MESREHSESKVNLEKDETLNAQPAQEPQTSENVPEAPVAEDVNNNEDAAPAPAVEEPVIAPEPEEPAKEEPVAEEPAKEEPVAEEPAKEEPVAEEPAKEEPVAEEPAKEEPVAEEPIVEEPVAEEPKPHVNYETWTKAELVDALEKLATEPIETIRDEVTHIKAAFYAKRKEEIEKEKAEFLAKGNEEAAFAVREDPDEVRMRAILDQLKEKRAEYHAQQEAQMADNLARKRAIIEEIKTISADTDNINRQFTHVKELQQEFKNIGPVPATAETEVWKTYQQTIESFYDLLKMNKELRDYDFKKNLEAKQQLCTEAEALDEENDVLGAFKKLQELHNKWREIGPVAKELREELWARFKAASAVINKKHQALFEERKAREKENADAKTALCEEVEKISTDGLKTYADWEEVTKKIIDLQQQWKKLGFASRKLNADLFARFRRKCDEFFAQKSEHFKSMREELAENMKKKVDLCEKAEALKDSTEWRATTDALVALQKEWKTIGPVAKKHSDAIWKRFVSACDYFFEQKKEKSTNIHAAEHENLKKKKEIIAQLRTMVEGDELENASDVLQDVTTNWQAIGHVPYKEKDKLFAQYKELLDQACDKFGVRLQHGGRSSYGAPARSRGERGGGSEREQLVRQYEQRCSELKTYENNLGFLSARSKSGNTLVQQLERKVDTLKQEIAELEAKIKQIDDKEKA